MHILKSVFALSLVYSYLLSDVKYTVGWNLLGGQIPIESIRQEEIWIFKNQEWVLRPNKIDKYQGFWMNASKAGVIKTYEHIFEQSMPSTYLLHSLQIQYIDSNKEILYDRDKLNTSNIKIKNDLSFEEHIAIDINETTKNEEIFQGQFMPLSDNINQIVEYATDTKSYFMSSVVVDRNILILIRHENNTPYGKIDTKYTYIREQ